MKNLKIIDQVTGTTAQGYTLDRVYRTDTDTIRVRVVRDSYIRQSSATAEVLDGRHWADLADNPASNWHDDTPPSAGHFAATSPATSLTITGALGGIADELARRAATILTAR